MKFDDPKKAARKSRRTTLIDLVIILVILSGMSLFYKLNVNRARAMQEKMQETVQQNTDLIQGRVVFFDSSNRKKLEIMVEIAENDYQQGKGMMFREDIPDNQGMLFTYEDELQRFFWMKNTKVSLDIIFVDATFKIVKIYKNTLALSENIYPSGVPVKLVVEVRAGFSDRHQLEVGQRISWEKL